MKLANRFLPIAVTIALLLSACAPIEIPPGETAPANTAEALPTPISTNQLPTAEPARIEQPENSGFCFPGSLPEGFLVVGYLPEYRPFDVSSANCVSDLIFFSLEPTPEGNLDTSRMTAERMKQLQEAKQRYGIRLHLSLGGWGRNGGFPEMVVDPARRQNFVSELAAFLVANDFDGVDYDWEFPETPAERQGYGALIAETRQAITGWGGLVSVALYPHPELDLAPYLAADRIHIMSYDRGERHSTFEQAVADLEFFLGKGAPPEKILLGLPFYGRLMEPPYTPYTYYEIIDQHNPAPDQEEAGGIYYNGPVVIQKKTCHAFQQGIGGVMMWELGSDVQPGSTHESVSLLKSTYEVANAQCVGR